jgi:predicted lipid-binding transport protein (Tim44 family)
MRPPLAVVQHAATAQPAPVPVHPESRAVAAVNRAVRTAWEAGHCTGERTGYVQGWRGGLACGLCWGCLLTGLGTAAAIAGGWL